MKKRTPSIRTINSISDLHRMMGLPSSEHPLISAISLDQIPALPETLKENIIYNFYIICMKKNFDGTLKYGQNYFDFQEGVLSFISPGQILAADIMAAEGWLLFLHPDLLQGHPLAKTIKEYGYFSYQISEALFLSEKEADMIENVFQYIAREYKSIIDHHSQNILLSQVGVLLSYSERFYTRQFITRKVVNNDLLSRLEHTLDNYFASEKTLDTGLPSVEYIAAQLNVSAHYLTDMLKVMTGQNTQQHIQNKIIEKAKQVISTTNLSVSEIAYQLGFKHPQSFNKLFKSKTNQSPLAFRQSLN